MGNLFQIFFFPLQTVTALGSTPLQTTWILNMLDYDESEWNGQTVITPYYDITNEYADNITVYDDFPNFTMLFSTAAETSFNIVGMYATVTADNGQTKDLSFTKGSGDITLGVSEYSLNTKISGLNTVKSVKIFADTTAHGVLNLARFDFS